jgi:hypothetical protein
MQKIPLSKDIAYVNQHQKDEFTKLFDGDVTEATRFTVWNPQIKPYVITFDLSDFETCKIQQLKYYNNTGNPSTLKYYYVRKDNGQKVLLKEYKGGGWVQGYQTVDILNAVNASYFIIESEGGSDFPDDLELWGEYTLKPVAVSTRPRSPLSELMGVVVKPWDIASDYMFPEKIPAIKEMGVKRVRLYDDYQLNHDNGNLIFDHNLWHQTANIKLLKDNGISTQQSYLATPYYPFTGDKLNPETYIQLAKDVYAYGVHNKDNVKTFEVENELNRWYGDFAREYMDGYQLAAMMSICYDGHKGKYPNVGMKASGSTALVSVPGMAEGEPYILYQMIEWSIKNRGYRADGTPDLPFDVYSWHCYPSLEGQRQGIPGTISPEVGAAPYFERINKVRKQYAPWLKIHIGEWSGGDINQYSPLAAPIFGKYSAHQSSAMFTVRLLLLMAENEIDASSYYRIKQDFDEVDDNNGIIFATMALQKMSGGAKQENGSYTGINIQRTLTGDYFKQISEFFNNGWVFDSRVSSSPIVLKFKKGTSEMYVIWQSETMTITDKPQFTERTGTYNLNVKGTLRKFVDDGSGVMSSEAFNGTITYGSKPVIVVVGETPNTPPPVTPTPIKEIYHRGYWTVSGKRVFYINYKDGTWTLANGKYEPIK